MSVAVSVKGLIKEFGGKRVVNGIDLQVAEGKVLCLLGHNGAGKSTTVRILSCLESLTAGEVSICGFDIVKSSLEVRHHIALAGQDTAVDELLSGFDNLYMIGRLRGLKRKNAQKIAKQLLEKFNLLDASEYPVKDYSGGMRRRLDLAACMVTQTKVVFLDEPSTGLDPTSRRELWRSILDLAYEGTAVFLTTQYLEEAEYLADETIVMASGQVVASGTNVELKSVVGSERVVIDCGGQESLEKVISLLNSNNIQGVIGDYDMMTVSLESECCYEVLRQITYLLEMADIDIAGIAIRRPSLDDVYNHFAIKE
jgi:hypothetical protein